MHDAAAEVENRFRGGIDHRCRTSDQFAVRRRHHIRTTGGGPFVDVDKLILNVLGNIDQDRSGAARRGDAEGTRNDRQQIVGRPDQEVVLGDRNTQTIGVDFLKSVGADHRLRYLAGDCHQRNRIEFGIGDGRQQVGGARPRRCHAYRWHAGGARHPLRHEAAALFVPSQHMVDLRLRERVINWQNRAAGNAGNGANALAFKQADDNLCSGECFGCLLGQGFLLQKNCRFRRRQAVVRKSKTPARRVPAGVSGIFCRFLRCDLASCPRRRTRQYAYDAYYTDYRNACRTAC